MTHKYWHHTRQLWKCFLDSKPMLCSYFHNLINNIYYICIVLKSYLSCVLIIASKLARGLSIFWVFRVRLWNNTLAYYVLPNVRIQVIYAYSLESNQCFTWRLNSGLLIDQKIRSHNILCFSWIIENWFRAGLCDKIDKCLEFSWWQNYVFQIFWNVNV